MFSHTSYCIVCKAETLHEDQACVICKNAKIAEAHLAWKRLSLEEKIESLKRDLDNLNKHRGFFT